MIDEEYFNWAYQGIEEAYSKDLLKKKSYKTCPEMGCENGFITLFTSVIECETCAKTPKKKK